MIFYFTIKRFIFKSVIFVVVIIAISDSVYAQFKYGMTGFGYESGTQKLDIHTYKAIPILNPKSFSFTNLKSDKLKFTNATIWMEGITPYVYAYVNITNIPFRKKNEANSIIAREWHFFDLRLAFGYNFAERVSIYGGGQFDYKMMENWGLNPDTLIGISSNGVTSNSVQRLYFDYFGGYRYGGNLTLAVKIINDICFRASFLYYNVSRKGIPRNSNYPIHSSGNSFDQDYALYLFIPKTEQRVGLRLSYMHALTSLKFTSTEVTGYIPDNKATSNYFNPSLIFQIGSK